MLKFYNIQQNTDEWDALRAGKVTSSELSSVMANFGKAFGEPAKKYAANIAVEQINGHKLNSESYSNANMERGHIQEPLARKAYEGFEFVDVDNGGFFENGNVGASPDGLVAKNGLIEIKSALAHIHLKRIQSQTYDPTYKWQLIGNLKITEREWIDFISYCADFPKDKQLYVRRLYAEQVKAEFKQIDERLEQFFELVEKNKQIINNTQMIVTEMAA